MPPTTDNGWSEWSRHVLAELERLNACYERLDARFGLFSSDLAVLKYKSGVWGAMAGSIPVAIGLLIWWLKRPI